MHAIVIKRHFEQRQVKAQIASYMMKLRVRQLEIMIE